MSYLITSQIVSEWESSIYVLFSTKLTVIEESLLNNIKAGLELKGLTLDSCAPRVKDLSSADYIHNYVVEKSKDITMKIILGDKILPPFENLGTSSRLICTVMIISGKDLYICLPVHYYHVLRSLNNNNDEENSRLISVLTGRIFVRMAKLDELDREYVTFERYGGLPILKIYQETVENMLKSTIYGKTNNYEDVCVGTLVKEENRRKSL